jgi:SHS2 domain-containing protein
VSCRIPYKARPGFPTRSPAGTQGATETSRRWGSFPTTADVGIWARADSTAELFEALGLGLFALMTDLRKIRPTEARAIQASGSDPASLLVAFLTQVITLHEVEGFVAREIRCRPVGNPPTALLAQLRGEPFDGARHTRHFEVKAATLHRLALDLVAHRARVIVDI